jgi:3-vinyl bacteriochlorophyllide hydratase
MEPNVNVWRGQDTEYAGPTSALRRRSPAGRLTVLTAKFSGRFETLFEAVAPCPWGAHAGVLVTRHREQPAQARAIRAPLYSPEERRRRDASPWTIVQGVLAPLQFLVFLISLCLVVRYLVTGQGYGAATVSVLLKTVLLYGIMITGSIWEKKVFGKWLFAKAFFWEDVFSILVLTLQTFYVAGLLTGAASPRQLMLIAVSAYAAYAINAMQFLLKLRAARLEAPPKGGAGGALSGAAV